MGGVGLCWFFGGEAEGRGVADFGECEGAWAGRGEEPSALGSGYGGTLVMEYGLVICLLKKLGIRDDCRTAMRHGCWGWIWLLRVAVDPARVKRAEEATENNCRIMESLWVRHGVEFGVGVGKGRSLRSGERRNLIRTSAKPEVYQSSTTSTPTNRTIHYPIKPNSSSHKVEIQDKIVLWS